MSLRAYPQCVHVQVRVSADDGQQVVVDVPVPLQTQVLLSDPEQPSWVRDDFAQGVRKALRERLEELGYELHGDPVVEM
jgi:hypothetical protein